MAQTVRGQDGGDRSLAPVFVCSAADNTESNRSPLYLQALWLARRTGLPLDRALLIAPAVFDKGKRR